MKFAASLSVCAAFAAAPAHAAGHLTAQNLYYSFDNYCMHSVPTKFDREVEKNASWLGNVAAPVSIFTGPAEYSYAEQDGLYTVGVTDSGMNGLSCEMFFPATTLGDGKGAELADLVRAAVEKSASRADDSNLQVVEAEGVTRMTWTRTTQARMVEIDPQDDGGLILRARTGG